MTQNACNSRAYYIVIRNLGNTLTYNSGTIQIYFSDSSTSSAGSATCSVSSVAAGGSTTCGGSIPSGLAPVNQGDDVMIKIVMPNGGAASYTVKALG